MPSANQLAGGKEGLNEANDPTAITAERRTLNIGIPVWNEWKGLVGAAAAGARRVFLPDNWCSSSSSSSRSIVIVHVLSPSEGSESEKWARLKYDKALSLRQMTLGFSFPSFKHFKQLCMDAASLALDLSARVLVRPQCESNAAHFQDWTRGLLPLQINTAPTFTIMETKSSFVRISTF